MVLIPIALAIVLLGGRAYAAIIAFMLILLVFEWTRIVDRAEFSRGFYTLSATAIGTAFVAASGQYGVALATGLAGGAVATALEFRKHPRVPWAMAGAVYLILPAVAALYVREAPADGRMLTLLLFTVVWATDSGAYLFGTFIGGPKLWPALSPKKTWAGAAGGIVCGAMTALALGALLGSEAPAGTLFGLGLLIGFAAVIGDLLESALKRAFKVKDTGGAFPGHGGVMDRLDGFILAVSALAILHATGLITAFG